MTPSRRPRSRPGRAPSRRGDAGRGCRRRRHPRRDRDRGRRETLPFLGFEAVNPHTPAVAVEVNDVAPQEWSAALAAAWARRSRRPRRLGGQGRRGGRRPDRATPARRPPRVRRPVGRRVRGHRQVRPGRRRRPYVVYGPGAAEKDNEVLVAVAEATKGERLALGLCEDKNYRTDRRRRPLATATSSSPSRRST